MAVASLCRPLSAGPRTTGLRAQQTLLRERGDKEPILVVCFSLTEIAPANCGSQSGRKEEPLGAPLPMKPDRVAQSLTEILRSICRSSRERRIGHAVVGNECHGWRSQLHFDGGLAEASPVGVHHLPCLGSMGVHRTEFDDVPGKSVRSHNESAGLGTSGAVLGSPSLPFSGR